MEEPTQKYSVEKQGMHYEPDRQYRRSIRLRGFDYSRQGAYFVTICVHNRECLLGDIAGGTVTLSDLGGMIDHVWKEIPTRFPSVVLDISIVMPNHLHGILIFTEQATNASVGAGLALPNTTALPNTNVAPNEIALPEDIAAHHLMPSPGVGGLPQGGASPAPTRLRLRSVVGAFKSLTAIQANRHLGRSDRPFWQRGFYEHIIRDEEEMERVRTYIQQNPYQWATDTENPTAAKIP